MNEIEEKLWNYIDGTCTEEERAATGILIETDEVYKQKYTELLQLNAGFANMDLDEPSMAFTYNVMQSVNAQTELKPLTARINNRVIWGIGAFFAITITAVLVFVLASINWTPASHAANAAPLFKMPQVSQYFDSNIIRGFLLFDMVLALYVLDTYLRKKLNNKQVQ